MAGQTTLQQDSGRYTFGRRIGRGAFSSVSMLQPVRMLVYSFSFCPNEIVFIEIFALDIVSKV